MAITPPSIPNNTPILNTGARLAVAPGTAGVAEGQSGLTDFVFNITRTGDLTGISSVSWSLAGSGADPANGADFAGGALPAGQVSFAIGESSKTITIKIAGDALVERNEGFTLTLINPVNAAIDVATATGIILNDDIAPPPGLTIEQKSWGATIAGSSGDDSFTIHGGGNTVDAGDGNDNIHTEGWNNTIHGGAGNDVIDAGEGNATVDAGAGDDEITLHGWGNTVLAGAGNDTVEGAQGNTTIDGGAGDNHIVVQGWGNMVTAGAGNNFVQGGEGNSQFILGNGDNTIQVWGWNNSIRLGHGDNTIEGIDGNTSIFVGDGDNLIGLKGWNNMLSMGDGANVVYASGGGDAHVTGGDGHNIIQLKGWNNVVDLGDGGNTVWAGLGMSKITLGAGNDAVWIGASGGSEVSTGAGDDVIYTGGATNDVLRGGTGNDNYVIRNAGATIIEKAGEGVDTVWVDVQGYAAPENVEIVRLIGDASSITGTAGNDVLVANQGVASTIRAGAGNDQIYGSTMADVFNGGAGNDIFYGGYGADRYVYDTATWGQDSVLMWQTGQSLDFRGSGLQFSDLAISQGQGFTMVAHGADSIAVYGAAQLGASDFLFG